MFYLLLLQQDNINNNNNKKGINQQLSKQASNPPSLEAVTVFNKYTRENIASNTSLCHTAHNHASGGKADSKVNVQ